MKSFLEYIGDSNPLKLPYIDDWHQAQYLAYKGDIINASEKMKKAAKEAFNLNSPGEAKYYLATAAWLLGKKDLTIKYANDPEVIQTGNHEVLHRLINSTAKDYKTAYNS